MKFQKQFPQNISVNSISKLLADLTDKHIAHSKQDTIKHSTVSMSIECLYIMDKSVFRIHIHRLLFAALRNDHLFSDFSPGIGNNNPNNFVFNKYNR